MAFSALLASLRLNQLSAELLTELAAQEPPVADTLVYLEEADVPRLIAAAPQSKIVSHLTIVGSPCRRSDRPYCCFDVRREREMVLCFRVGPGAVGLCHSLDHATSLTTLRLSDIVLDEAAATAIAAGLANHSTLREMSLKCDKIHPDGTLSPVAAALAENTTLQTLSVSLCRAASDADVSAFFAAVGENRGLKSFHVERITLTARGSRAAGTALARNTCLEELRFVHCALRTSGAALFCGLARNCGLLRFTFRNSSVLGDDASAALGNALAQHPRLQRVHLTGWVLGKAENVAAIALGLARSESLLELDLSENRLRDDGATALAEAVLSMGRLNTLDLASNLIGDEGAAALGHALARHGALEKLVLRNNLGIGDAGGRALAEGLQRNGSLKELDMTGVNSVGLAGLRYLCTGLERNHAVTHFTCTDATTGFETDAAVAALRALLRCNTNLVETPYCMDFAIKAALITNRVFFCATELMPRRPSILPRLLASMSVVLMVMRGSLTSGSGDDGAPQLLLHSSVPTDLIFSVSRAQCDRGRRRRYRGVTARLACNAR